MWILFLSVFLYLLPYDYADTFTNKMDSEALDQIPDVIIDGEGDFKYILLKVKGLDGQKKFLVRGTRRHFYHAEIFNEYTGTTLKLKKRSKCVGGGRILHEPEKKCIKVFGDSQGFGRANHSITAEILKKFYPDYNVTWSNEDGPDWLH